jgi:cytochrome b involved in lipid metabolism
MSQSFSISDVASHNKPTDLYIIVDEDVYDLTAFADEHPGMTSPIPSAIKHNT